MYSQRKVTFPSNSPWTPPPSKDGQEKSSTTTVQLVTFSEALLSWTSGGYTPKASLESAYPQSALASFLGIQQKTTNNKPIVTVLGHNDPVVLDDSSYDKLLTLQKERMMRRKKKQEEEAKKSDSHPEETIEAPPPPVEKTVDVEAACGQISSLTLTKSIRAKKVVLRGSSFGSHPILCLRPIDRYFQTDDDATIAGAKGDEDESLQKVPLEKKKKTSAVNKVSLKKQSEGPKVPIPGGRRGMWRPRKLPKADPTLTYGGGGGPPPRKTPRPKTPSGPPISMTIIASTLPLASAVPLPFLAKSFKCPKKRIPATVTVTRPTSAETMTLIYNKGRGVGEEDDATTTTGTSSSSSASIIITTAGNDDEDDAPEPTTISQRVTAPPAISDDDDEDVLQLHAEENDEDFL